MRKNDSKVREAVARVAGVSADSVFVDDDGDVILVNHQESMTWSAEKQDAVEAEVKRITGKRASVT